MDYYSDAPSFLPSLLLTQMQIGRGALTPVNPLLGIVFSWVLISYVGVLRNIVLSLNLVRKPNIVLLHMLVLIQFGVKAFYVNFNILFLD